MDEKSIKLKRVESLLKELIPEALATLSDEKINNIPVLDVVCSKGKYDAKVYLDPSFVQEEEKAYILSHLRRASSHIQNYCKQAEGWYRAPNMNFIFDDNLQKQNQIDKLFEQIEKELNKNG